MYFRKEDCIYELNFSGSEQGQFSSFCKQDSEL
jgi:hypothetical protein